ncbi:MAG: hypothetical protein JXQ91_09450 [Vannielia sp.]|uniref:acyl-CoA dehydrogenase family protein n=1 Tax=Vannielia sp. TaxID=2813045 RepID=UPI003B8B4D15
MEIAFNEDQVTFTTFLDQMLGSDDAAFRAVPGWGRHDYGTALDEQLEANGFFDAAAEETLGPVMAAEMVYKIARLPVVVECAASALLRPLIAPELPRPIAVIEGDALASRFLPVARSAIWLSPEGVRAATLPQGAAGEVESLFAYPMGRIDGPAPEWKPLEVDPARALALWRIGLAAELSGALQGGLASVLEHVRERRQFGRPLGSFQGVQHRLAADTVQIEAARLLTLKAAQSGGAADAALALGQAQTAATRIIYDLHQFMGAMGLTLEHPLHRMTYRARLLRAAMGGATRSLRSYADARWGAA